jgi:hypothetical protein
VISDMFFLRIIGGNYAFFVRPKLTCHANYALTLQVILMAYASLLTLA